MAIKLLDHGRLERNVTMLGIFAFIAVAIGPSDAAQCGPMIS